MHWPFGAAALGQQKRAPVSLPPFVSVETEIRKFIVRLCEQREEITNKRHKVIRTT
jgi:hypothetical protein